MQRLRFYYAHQTRLRTRIPQTARCHLAGIVPAAAKLPASAIIPFIWIKIPDTLFAVQKLTENNTNDDLPNHP